jgi:Flp pilus assembly protein TadD
MGRRSAERNPRDASVLSAYAQALAAAGRERESIGVEERAVALQPPGPERLDRRAALAARAEAAGDLARALWLYQGVRTARPEDVSVLAGLARIYASSNDAFQLASVARDLQRLGATTALGSLAAPAARAILRGGDAATALPFFRDALRLAPHDLSILRDLATTAERAGAWPEALSAGAALADAEAERHPSTAAARLGHLAEIAAGLLDDPQLAAHLRQRAATLSPFDVPLEDPAQGGFEPSESASAGADTPGVPPSIEQALARVREAPFDAVAAGQLAGLARLIGTGNTGPHAARLAVLTRSAAALAAFATGTAPRATASARAMPVAPDRQASVAHPLARSSSARLFALLAPYLEPLFPADLARRGVTATDRLGPDRAPDVLRLFEDLRLALGVRLCFPFLRDGQGTDISIENTTPPSVVLASGVVTAASASERRYLLARALALVEAGWALAGKFAPRDVGMMCELACRFAGFTPQSPMLPDVRARPFVQALTRVPERVRQEAIPLAAEAVMELPAIAAPQLVEALWQGAARTALLHGGDPYAALTATVDSDPRLATLPLSESVAHPDLRDLALFALSEPYLLARAEAEAKA